MPTLPWPSGKSLSTAPLRLGKRRTEFAEVVLADFYQAQRIIDEARSPGSMGNEGSTRPKVAGETEDEERTLNAYFVTAERLNNRSEFFAQHSNPRFPGARGWAPCPLVSRHGWMLIVCPRRTLPFPRDLKQCRLSEVSADKLHR
jgi:hypothetical protein